MDYVQRWKFSWSLVATVAFIVVLVSVVHVFLFPVVPSFDYLSVRHAQNCIPINESTKGGGKDNVLNLDARFPADLHKAVIYRGTPWKSEIGRWLSDCNPIITTIKVVENIGGKSCKRDCGGQGICNYDLGHCRCFHGFSGEGCSEKLHLDCNYPGSKDQPYGHWVVSICPAYCDTTRAMCFCGEGTKYPNRPVAEACGFKMSLPSELDGPKLTDWTKADLDNIFTTNGSRPGWCNVDPEEAYASRVQFKEECDCKYDCLWGRFCEVPVQCTCINQCSGHGNCRGGFCQHVNRLEITPDKSYLAAAGNPHIRLFDVNSNTPQPLASFESHTNNVMAVGFQCDGKWMYSGSEDGTVKIWDLRAPGCQREYESRAAVNTVVLHPNQTELISGDQNGNIRVWDLTANSCSCELVPEVDTAVRSLTVMWDGSLVVAANNRGTCYVWRLLQGTQTMTNFEPLHKLQAHDGYILKCLLSPELCEPNRYLATASSDGTVKIWNVGGFTLEKTLTGHQRWVWDCVFSVDGAFLITASSDYTARLWSMATGENLKVYQGHHKATICCALHDGAEPSC